MTHVRLVPKLQATSVKYVGNGLLWVKWSVLWVTNACSAGPLDALRSETIAVGIPQFAQFLAVGFAYEDVEGGGAAGAGESGDGGGR